MLGKPSDMPYIPYDDLVLGDELDTLGDVLLEAERDSSETAAEIG